MDWQSIIAMLIVALAAAWLLRRVARIIRSASRGGKGHISACGHCPRNPQVKQSQPVVTLGVSKEKRA